MEHLDAACPFSIICFYSTTFSRLLLFMIICGLHAGLGWQYQSLLGVGKEKFSLLCYFFWQFILCLDHTYVASERINVASLLIIGGFTFDLVFSMKRMHHRSTDSNLLICSIPKSCRRFDFIMNKHDSLPQTWRLTTRSAYLWLFVGNGPVYPHLLLWYTENSLYL